MARMQIVNQKYFLFHEHFNAARCVTDKFIIVYASHNPVSEYHYAPHEFASIVGLQRNSLKSTI